MLLKLLYKLNSEKVFIAGLDGYSHNVDQNYVYKNMILNIKSKNIRGLNLGISNELKKLSNKLDIEFITPTKYN